MNSSDLSALRRLMSPAIMTLSRIICQRLHKYQAERRISESGRKDAAHMAGTDFIPVISEQYDVVVLKQNRELVQSVQDILNSEEFKSQLSQLSGYDTKMTGRLIYET